MGVSRSTVTLLFLFKLQFFIHKICINMNTFFFYLKCWQFKHFSLDFFLNLLDFAWCKKQNIHRHTRNPRFKKKCFFFGSYFVNMFEICVFVVKFYIFVYTMVNFKHTLSRFTVRQFSVFIFVILFLIFVCLISEHNLKENTVLSLNCNWNFVSLTLDFFFKINTKILYNFHRYSLKKIFHFIYNWLWL